MIFSPSNRDDICRYYSHTYVKFPETGDKLHFIRDVHQNIITGNDSDGNEFELFLSDDFPYEVDFVLPRKSFFQVGKRAVLLQRMPAKQYQRGLSQTNTRLNDLTRNGEVRELDLTFELLASYVAKPSFPSFETAVLNKAANMSTALSQRFALCPTVGYIFVDLTVCATYSKDTKVVACMHPILRPELEALVAGSSYKVV